MKTKMILGLFILFSGVLAHATEYHLATDFSTNANPNGVWTYGWLRTTWSGNSSFEVLNWETDGWMTANGIKIWKNTTDLAPRQISIDSSLNEPAVVRWVAPQNIGSATIQISGELPSPTSGIEIRRGAGVVLSVTNTSVFSVELLVDPGDSIDFVALDGGTKSLNLSITTLQEHLDLITFDDFNRRYPENAWTTIPGSGGVLGVFEGDPPTNSCLSDLGEGDWLDGAYREMPFRITRDTPLTSFRYVSSFGSAGHTGYAATGLRFSDNSIRSGDTRIVEFQMRVYPEETPTDRLLFMDGDCSGVFTNFTGNRMDKIEFRLDLDWNHKDAQGTYGLFSLFTRRLGKTQWIPTKLQQINMKIINPAQITKLCAIVNHDSSFDRGYKPFLDDIRYCVGKNSPRRPRTNLLLGARFDPTPTPWRMNAIGTFSPPKQSKGYLEFDGGTTQHIQQIVNLLSQGFSATDLDAKTYQVVFGGRQKGNKGKGGYIQIDFLDQENQLIRSAKLPTITADEWTQQRSTNAIPAQTRSIRYNYTFSEGAFDDAYLGLIQN